MTKHYISHHGIKGQRWGVRRYQNEDGTLTPAGQKRYGTFENMQKVRSRNRNIAIGLGVAAAAVGAGYLINRNKKMKNKLSVFEAKEAKRKADWDIARSKRWIKDNSSRIKIPKGATVKVTDSSKKTMTIINTFLNVKGGSIVRGGG